MSTPYVFRICFRWRLLPAAAYLALGLLLMPAPGLWGQSAAAPSPGQPAMQFEVLDVTTGSGSKTQPASGAILGVDNGQPLQQGQPQGQEVIPAVPTAMPGITPAPPRQLTPEEQQLVEKHKELMAALENWHRQVLSNYRVDVTRLGDPFLPIKEVRGTIPEEEEYEFSPDTPMIERFDLSQLKLVAITMLTDRPANGWASFEDGTGTSYILSVGDRIGRNNGKITKILPSVVTVEETGRRGTERPKVTDIKLSVLSREGLSLNE